MIFRKYKKKLSLKTSKRIGVTLTPIRRCLFNNMLIKKKNIQKSNSR